MFSLPLREWLSLWMVYLWMVARKTSLLLANGEVSGAKHAASHFRVPLDFVEIVLCWLMPGKSDICFWRGCSHWLFWVCGQALMETAVGKRLRQKIVVLMRKSQSMRTKRGACETSVIELWTSALVFEMVPGHLSFRGNPCWLVRDTRHKLNIMLTSIAIILYYMCLCLCLF